MTQSAFLTDASFSKPTRNSRVGLGSENKSESQSTLILANSSTVDLRYAPLRILKTKLLKNEETILFSTSFFFLALVLGKMFMFSGSADSLTYTWFYYAVLFLFTLVIVPLSCLACRSKYLKVTGNVRIDESGLWLSSTADLAASDPPVLVCWKDLISVAGKPESGALRDLVFEFSSSGWGWEKRNRLSSWGANKPLRQEIRLDFRGFAQRDHERIEAAVQRFVPPNCLHASLQKKTALESGLSYTSLWLESLGSSSRRLASSVLTPGVFLCRHRYELLRQIATGGQATTYEAIDHGANLEAAEPSRVVLKEFVVPVHAERAAVAEMFTELETTTKIMRDVASKNIVKLLGSFIEDFRFYLVLEYVEGETLRDLVSRTGSLSGANVIGLGLQMCEILTCLHAQANPVVHRDFSPDNLILTPAGVLKLIDFDVAVNQDQHGLAKIVGKPSYLAPEQFRGEVAPICDIYSLGATMYFLLTAKDPTPISISHPRLSNQAVEEILDAVVARATATAGADRYRSSSELAGDLHILQEAQSK